MNTKKMLSIMLGLLGALVSFPSEGFSGSVPISASNVNLTPKDTGSNAMLVNVSTLGGVGVNAPMTSGFVVSGSQSKALLIRAVGPSLVNYGISTQLVEKNPVLNLYNSSGTIIATNSGGWSNDPATLQAIASTGAFPIMSGTADCVILVTLPPGAYTAITTAVQFGGSAIVEVYEVNDGSSSKVINLSTKFFASQNYSTLGFWIGGTGQKEVLIRISGADVLGTATGMNNPALILYSGGTMIGYNDTWNDTSAHGSQEVAAEAVTGAFPFKSNVNTNGGFAASQDASIVVMLPPGGYTVEVACPNGNQFGQVLIEVYDVPNNSVNIVSGYTPPTPLPAALVY